MVDGFSCLLLLIGATMDVWLFKVLLGSCAGCVVVKKVAGLCATVCSKCCLVAMSDVYAVQSAAKLCTAVQLFKVLLGCFPFV